MNVNYNTGYKKYIYSSTNDIKLDIKISNKQHIFDKTIYPIVLFKECIDRQKKFIKYLGIDKYNESLSNIYKYKFLKDQVYNKSLFKSLTTKTILLYIYNYNEIHAVSYLINFNVISNKSNILLITNLVDFINAVPSYMYKYLNSSNLNNIKCVIPTKYAHEMYNKNKIKYKIDYTEVAESFNNTTINNIINSYTIKFDYILINCYYQENLFDEMINHTNLISNLCIALSLLNKNGSIGITINTLLNKVSKQILNYIFSLFNKKYLFFKNLSYCHHNHIYILCENFKGIDDNDIKQLFNLNEELYKIDPTGFKNYNILDKDIRKEFDITKPINDTTQKLFIDCLYDDKFNNEELDKQIYNFNLHKLNIFRTFLDDFEEYIKNTYIEYKGDLYLIRDGKDYIVTKSMLENNKKYLEYIDHFALENSIDMAKRMNLELRPGVIKNLQSDKLLKKLIYNMFSISNVIKYKFRKYCKTMAIKLDKTELNYMNEDLERIKIEFLNINELKIISDIKLYDRITQFITYYERTLAIQLNRRFDIAMDNKQLVDRTWLKYRELFVEINSLIDKSEDINVLHIGNNTSSIINSINNYLESIEYTKKYNYYTNSDFTKSVNIDIINSYIKKYKDKNINLVIIDWKYIDNIGYILYAIIIFVLGLLDQGSNFIIKMYLPFSEPLFISLFYIISCRFKKFYFFKSLQNQWSPSFYLVGIDYQYKLNTDNYNTLLNIVDKYDTNYCLIKESNIIVGNLQETTSDYLKFQVQLANILNIFKNNYKLAIVRYIYYIDNWDNLSIDVKNNIKLNIHNKNEDWVTRYIVYS